MISVERGAIETVSTIYERLKPGEAYTIGYGGLGRHFLALELYRVTREKDIKREIYGSLDKAERYRKSAKTSNYSLFNGWSGLSCYYLECFKLTKEEIFLAKAIEVAKDYTDNISYPFRSFDQSGLVNGTAGIMIHYLSLFTETGEPWIKEFVRECLHIMIDRANVTEAGIYWNGMYPTDRPIGWAYGGHGVAYCLSQLGRYFKNDVLLSIAGLAIKEEDRFRRPEVLGYADGVVGEALVKLYLSTGDGFPEYSKEWQDVANRMDAVLARDCKDVSADIFGGLSGWGLAFYEAYTMTGDQGYQNSAQKIASVLFERMSGVCYADDIDASFFSGLSGICYSFLKIIGNDNSPSLLLPRLIDYGAADEMNSVDNGTDPIKLTEANIILMRNNFTETYAIMNREFPGQLKLLLSSSPIMSFPVFKRSIDGIIGDLSDEQREKLLDQVDLDQAMIGMKERVDKFIPIRDDRYAEKIGSIARLNDKDILALRVAISERILLWSKEDDIDYSLPLFESFFRYQMTKYGYRSYFIWHDGFRKFQFSKCRENKILVDLFKEPKFVFEAVDEFTCFVMRHDDHCIGYFMKAFNARNEEQLRAAIVAFSLKSVKKMLVEGILFIHDQN